MSDPHISTSNHDRYFALDGMCGIAALSIMIYHLTQHGGHSQLPSATLSVDLFFMLSGFVLERSYGQLILSRAGILPYLIKRLVRLYPMYFLGLVFGTITLGYMSWAGLTDTPQHFVFNSFFSYLFFVPTFKEYLIYHIGLFRGGFSGIIFCNLPLWSLSFEMLASLAFPILVRLKPSNLFNVILFSYITWVLSSFGYDAQNHWGFDFTGGWNAANYLIGFPRVFYGFCLEILLSNLARDTTQFQHLRIFSERYIKSPYVLYVVLILMFAVPKSTLGLYPAFIVTVVAPCLVFIGATLSCQGTTVKKLSQFLGWISYPLYCLHFPIGEIVFLIAAKKSYSLGFATLCSIALTFIAAVILTKIYEEPVRAFFSRRSSVANLRAP